VFSEFRVQKEVN